MFTFPFTNFAGGSLFINEYSAVFNGVDAWINCGQAAPFAHNVSFSYECYIKTSSATNMALMGKVLGGGVRGSSMKMSSGNIHMKLTNSLTTSDLEVHTDAVFDDGLWHHVVTTYDGTSLASGINIYVDGFLRSTTTDLDTLTGTITSSANFGIGARNGSNHYVDGQLDEVVVYDKELSQAEVTSRFNLGVFSDPLKESFSANVSHYWRLGDGDDDATTTYDLASTFDGTLANMDASNYITDVRPAPGFSVFAASLNGTDEYINMGNAFSYTDNLSVFLWVQTGNLTSNRTIFSKRHTGINQRSWALRVTSGGKIRVYVSSDGGGTNEKDYTSTDAGHIENNGWHLVGFTFASGTLKLYVDGSEVTTSKGSDPTVSAIHAGTTDINVGRQRSGIEYFPGDIDDTTIWTGTVLSDANIATLYNSGLPSDPTTLSLAGTLAHWWRMGDGDDATTVYDNVGSADGTLANMDASNYTTDVPS